MTKERHQSSLRRHRRGSRWYEGRIPRGLGGFNVSMHGTAELGALCRYFLHVHYAGWTAGLFCVLARGKHLLK